MASEDELEIREHWERVAATPWHKRDPRSIEQHLTPPISRWGRAIYYVLLPVAVIAILLSNLALFLLR